MNSPLEIVTDNQRLRLRTLKLIVCLVITNVLSLLLATGVRAWRFQAGLEITAEWFTDPANLARYSPGSYSI